MNYFISDLDKTLIFSGHPECKNVEKYQGREITFMTKKSYELFHKLLKVAMFIPCTMRSLSQTTRIDFVREYNPKYMICTNGAEIFINGELDKNWDNEMKKLVSKEEILDLQEKVDNLNLDLVENRNVNDFYIALKFKTTHLDKELELLREIVPECYNIQQDGIKVFLLNKLIDKSNAIIYLIEKENLKGTYFVAGDSNADKKMCNLTFTKNYIPKHATFESSNAYKTKQEKIFATEEILEQILLECYKNQITYIAELDQDVDDFVAVKYLHNKDVLNCIVLDPIPSSKEGKERVKELKDLGIIVKNSLPPTTKIVFCGGALTTLSQYLRTHKIDLLVMNGGFVGSNIIPLNEQLKKFKNKETIRTFNFNLDVEATHKILTTKNIQQIILVGKNVCHSSKNTLDGIWNNYKDIFEDISPTKRQHDMLACHEGLAYLGIESHFCNFEKVRPYNEGLKGNMTLWGSTKENSPYNEVLSAISYI